MLLLLGVLSITCSIPASATAINDRAIAINAVTLRFDPVRDHQLDVIQSDRFPAVRIAIEWPEIEPSKGNYNWTSTDRQIIGALQRNLNVLGVITYTPSWAADPAGMLYIHPAPASPTTFGNFVSVVAQRYRGMVGNWEIWNEPNVQASFAPKPDVAKYSAMLRTAYAGIKSIDPYSVVITGGTSPAIDAATAISPATFIQGLYNNGAANSFDAVAMHPYSVPDLLSAGGGLWYSSATAINGVSNVLLKYRQSYKKLWFTEFGAATAPGQPYGVTEARQTDILLDGISYMRSLPNCGPIFLFDHLDIETGNANTEFNYGLRRSDFTAKPSLSAVQAVMSSM